MSVEARVLHVVCGMRYGDGGGPAIDRGDSERRLEMSEGGGGTSLVCISLAKTDLQTPL
ncbi:hypothetical protein SERLADRAFT_471677 [Serpula lacrymans var. lacrymans S7.9]|uniref:Uncharacterized protein n=1 Tax=Serpula lacrymans var. lacrymans (strain S7.9) TaxID=578457 RepID=F8P1K2_SERL9|nr:uncharacterized protein SERLADRAFT_471677 [Serpula lacrymans var. lacrymans S7.9]EGO23031.1 hypothetical protein SERLADRAFT_471677 [Serpula lacrymans var. lacrymans S7.9]